METAPADVQIARAVRAHTRALVTLAAAAVVLAAIGAAALSFAGDDLRTPPITAGLSMLAVGQVCALIAAAIAGLGLIRVLREVGEPGSDDSAAAARSKVPSEAIRATASRFAILMRVIVGACVLVISVWAIANTAGIVGAAVGAVVVLQVVVALALLRVHLLRAL